MIVFFALLSLLGVVVAVVLPVWSDLLLLAGPCLVACLWLIWRGAQSGRRLRDAHSETSGPTPFRRENVGREKAGRSKAGPHVIIDGSNVMHWQDNVPSLGPVISAVRQMEAKGFTVGVIFDANAGYKIHDRYQDDHHMARRLGLPEDRVLVVPKGVSADEYILKAARGLGARVVTNDRYRDWLEAFPEAAGPGFLIRGGVKAGDLWLNERDLVAGAAAPVRP